MKCRSKIRFVLLSLSFVIMASTCKYEDENHHKIIRFINNSDKSVYIYDSWDYPDTLSAESMGGGGLSYPLRYKVDPNVMNSFALQLWEYYEDIFENGWEIPSDTIIVFVFDGELLESRTTNVANTVIRRYDLSLQDLQSVNWVLTYPPSPNMSSIKMSPPYELK